MSVHHDLRLSCHHHQHLHLVADNTPNSYKDLVTTMDSRKMAPNSYLFLEHAIANVILECATIVVCRPFSCATTNDRLSSSLAISHTHSHQYSSAFRLPPTSPPPPIDSLHWRQSIPTSLADCRCPVAACVAINLFGNNSPITTHFSHFMTDHRRPAHHATHHLDRRHLSRWSQPASASVLPPTHTPGMIL